MHEVDDLITNLSLLSLVRALNSDNSSSISVQNKLGEAANSSTLQEPNNQRQPKPLRTHTLSMQDVAKPSEILRMTKGEPSQTAAVSQQYTNNYNPSPSSNSIEFTDEVSESGGYFSVVRHIKLLNNSYNQLRVDFSRLFHNSNQNDELKSLVSRCICVSQSAVSSEIIYLYEHLVGKVKITNLNLLKLKHQQNNQSGGGRGDGLAALAANSVVIRDQFCFFSNMAVNEKYIIVAYRRWHRQFLIKVYDSRTLQLKNEETLANIEIYSIKLDNSSEKMYIVAADCSQSGGRSAAGGSASSVVKEYDILRMKKLRSFGQLAKETKPFFVRDEIIDIKFEKVFTKYKNSLRAASSLTGVLQYSFNLNYLCMAKVIVMNRSDLGRDHDAAAIQNYDSEFFQVFFIQNLSG